MTVAAVSMVKDELDVIVGSILHMVDEVDFLIVADNGSTDGTREALAELADDLPLDVIDDPDPAYYQSVKMSRLGELAYSRGARWVVPFDADELWFSRGDRMSVILRDRKEDVVRAELYNHFPSGVDPEGADPFRTIIWRQKEPAPLPKVAIRWREGTIIDQGNHSATMHGRDMRIGNGLEVRHFPYRSAEQFIRKARNGAAAYAATDLPPEVGAHWRGYGQIYDRYGEEACGDVFRQHFWHLSPVDNGMVPDPAPYMRWQQS